MIHALIGLLIFAFFALGGLIVDVGFARLTQRQMNTAAEAAAMEGVRLQDSAADETARRAAAADMLRNHFDDDLQGTAADPSHYGAGPLVTLSGGATSMGALKKIEFDSANPVYEPSPQLNLPNAAHGDMVSGAYDLSDLQHLEGTNYARTDFTPGGAGGLDAFLVRLRRTRNDFGLDEQAGVSSRGPELPYLFGRGSMIDAGTRARGITVRATAIAGARRATLVGLPDLAAGFTGYTPFLLEDTYWNAMTTGQEYTLWFGGNGTLGGGNDPPGGPPEPNPFWPYEDRGGPPIIPPGQINGGGDPVGLFDDRRLEDRRSWSIGDRVYFRIDLTFEELNLLLAWLGSPQNWDPSFPGVVFYVPLYQGLVDWDGIPGRQPGEAFKEEDPRVVGFGAILVTGARGPTQDVGGIGTPAELDFVKLPSLVAPLNASAVSTPGLAGSFANLIIDRHKEVDEPLRAAALVR